MGDKLLMGVLNLVIMTTITLLAGATLVCAHTGVLRLLGGKTTGSWGWLIGSTALAVATGLIIKYRNDLVDR